MYLKKIAVSSLVALLKNKSRSALTMLGIIIGVAAVITMQAVGSGTRQDVREQVASLGTNMIVVTPEAARQQGVRSDAGSAKIFKRRHVDKLAASCPAVLRASPVVMTPAQVKFGAQNWRTSVMGVYASYLNIRNIEICKGVPLSEEYDQQAAQVCVVGKTVADNLFGKSGDPIGKTIRVGHVPLNVIGLLKEKGQSGFGQDQDDVVLAPLLTLQKRMIEDEWVQVIFASARTEGLVPQAVTQIKTFLAAQLASEGKSSQGFDTHTSSEISEAAARITQSLSYLLAAMAAISLVVGGIGIMNIMLVSVTERTREIGLRLAVGATPFDVWFQLLTEAVALSLTAGIIGIGLGLLLSWGISDVLGWTTLITTQSVFLAFVVSSAVGVFFGWYPARKASALNPIDALRYE